MENKTSDYYYDLPSELIAQEPIEKRDESRLMVLNRVSQSIENRKFSDILEYLEAGDVLVLNDSRVIPARMHGHRRGKDESIEVLIAEPLSDSTWNTLVKPGKKMKLGTEIVLSDTLKGEVVGINPDGSRRIKFEFEGDLFDQVEKIGEMPTPPYITKKLEERERYQTVYAKEKGSVAAPTAGLHFTDELLKKIETKGVSIQKICLHVGMGTFVPVKEEDFTKHKMHSEFYSISEEVARNINKAKEEGRRIISVGTTTTRTLESAGRTGKLLSGSGKTDIFIYPGFKFNIVDSLITNFHLPESTLLMLVSAFYNREEILKAYEVAKSERYRFFSFGDSMLIL